MKKQLKNSKVFRIMGIILVLGLTITFIIGIISAKETAKEKYKGFDVEKKEKIKGKTSRNTTIYYLNYTDEQGRQLKVISYGI